MNDGYGDTTDDIFKGNIRYYGSDPKNYIYFNCDDYSDVSTCDRWRIIGIVDGKIKIINQSSIGSLTWDYDYNDGNQETTFSNVWSSSSLKNLLNGSYYNNSNTTYYWINYDGQTASQTLNFNSNGIGITDETRKNGIIDNNHTWYIGGLNSVDLYPAGIYSQEKNETWNGSVGLLSVTDYGYGAKRECAQQLSNYYFDSNCKYNNWIYSLASLGEMEYWWFINKSENSTEYVAASSAGGDVSLNTSSNYYYDYAKVSFDNEVYPVVFLNSDLPIDLENGDGSYSQPYRIKVE